MKVTTPGVVGSLAPGSALHLVDAPAIPGLNFRTWRGEADPPAIASADADVPPDREEA